MAGNQIPISPETRLMYIYYEFKSGKPIFDGFKNLCQSMGQDFMSYQEFDFWFMRFSKGNFDLTHDRSKELKCSGLGDMPAEIFNKIAKDVDVVSRIALGNVCRQFKRIANKWDLKLTEVSIEGDKRCQLSYEITEEKPLGIDLIKMLKDVKTVNKTRKISVGTLVRLLKDPRIKVKTLRMSNLDNVLTTAEWVDRRLGEPQLESAIHVEELRIKGCSSAKGFILFRHLKPGVLRELKIYSPWQEADSALIDVFNTGQFWQLDTISVLTPRKGSPNFLQADSPTFLQTTRANWIQNCPNLSFRISQNVRDIALSGLVVDLLESKKLRTFQLKTRNLLDGFVKDVLRDRKNVITVDEQTFHSPIADTNDFFEVKFDEMSVCIVRKTY